MSLLGKIVKLKEYTPRTNKLTVVPVEIIPHDDGYYHRCIIVRGNTLDGKGVGEYIGMDLDFHTPYDLQGHTIIELGDDT